LESTGSHGRGVERRVPEMRKENKPHSVLGTYLGHLLVWCSLHIPATCTVMFVTFSLIIFQLFLGVNLSSGASRGAA